MEARTLLKIFENRLYKYKSDNPLEYQNLCNTFQLDWKIGLEPWGVIKSLRTSSRTYDNINVNIKFEYRNFGPTNHTNFERLDRLVVLKLSGTLMADLQWDKRETYSNSDLDIDGEFELNHGWCKITKSYPEAIHILKTIFKLYLDTDNNTIKWIYHLDPSEIEIARNQVKDWL